MVERVCGKDKRGHTTEGVQKFGAGDDEMSK
jgi:hypothetical protein